MKIKTRTIIVAVIVLSLLVSSHGRFLALATAAQAQLLYISDIQIFQASTLEDCIKLCKEVGYTPYEQNLNEGAIEKVSFGSDVDAPCVIIGYKTTTNVNQAVTDVSILRMGEGYEIREYQAIAAALLSKNQNYAEGLAAAASDFSENYDKGAPSAVQALEMLNLLYVDDLEKHTLSGYIENKSNDSPVIELLNSSSIVNRYLKEYEEKTYLDFDWSDHVPLGDYLLEGNGDAEFFSKLISFATPAILNSVTSALCTGSAEYENEFNAETGNYETRVWADRLYDSDVRIMMKEGLTTNEWRSFDSAYMDSARQISVLIQDFATQYLNAVARGASVSSIGAGSDADSMEDVIEEMESMTDSSLDGLYIAAYEMLNQYRYDDSQGVGDWIVSMGNRTYASEEDYRNLYVLADALSPAQLVMMKYSGFLTFANKMLQPKADDPDAKSSMEDIKNALKGLVQDGEEYRVSVWMGVDHSIYYGKIAMTSDAIRQSGANAVLQLTQAEKAEANAKIRQKYITIGTGILSVFTIVANLAIHIKGGWSLTMEAAKAGVAALGGFWGGLCAFTSVITKINLILLVIEILVTIGIAIYNYVKEELHQPSSEYTDMPSLLFETKDTSAGTRVVKYNAVTEPYRGRIGDLNAYTGYKWNLLYASHDSDAGSPLVVSTDTGPFSFKQVDSSTPKGYVPVSQFGQLSAADLNVGAYDLKENAQNFLFCTTEKSIKDLNSVPSDSGESDEDKAKEGKYISDIKLFSENTVERTKAKVTTQKGSYYLFDHNLGTDKTPCYIGYSLTDLEKNAVRDIRVFAGEAATSIQYGQAEYTLSGALPNGDGVYISRDSLVGTPILSELAAVSSPKDAKEGWEAVVGFSGAPAARFGKDNFAIYFEPQEKYTSGQQYVSGIYFIRSLSSDRSVDPDQTMNELDRQSRVDFSKGETEYYRVERQSYSETSIADVTEWTNDVCLSGNNLSSAFKSQRLSDVTITKELFFAYSLTYNPYRAIRDVALWTSDIYNDMGLDSTISRQVLFYQNGVERSVGASYAACDTYYTNRARAFCYVESNHAEVVNHAYRDDQALCKTGDYYTAPAEDGFQYSWKRSPVRMQGLYVLGPVEGMDPLTASDVAVSSARVDAKDTDGTIGVSLKDMRTLDGQTADDRLFHSVQDMKSPYTIAAQNLSYPELTDDDGDKELDGGAPLYLYLAGTVHRPTYISSVVVGSFNEKNKIANDIAWRKAISSSNAEIIPTDLVLKWNETWNGKKDRYGCAITTMQASASYIGVTRTDDVSKAIRGLLLVKKSAVQPGSAPAQEIVVGGKSSISTATGSGKGTTYYLAQGSDPVPLADGDYYLYYSNNKAANPGSPVKDIFLNDQVFSSGSSTVLSSNTTGKDAEVFGNSNVENYIHMKYDYTSGTLFNAFYIGTGKNYDAAALDLIAQGATEAAAVDINLGTGDAVMIGWRTMSVSDEDIASHKKNIGKSSDPLREAIRDIILTIDKPYQNTLICNDVVYKPVGKRNLNSGNGGNVIYMYTCTDYDTWAYNLNADPADQLSIPSLSSDYASPLVQIGLSKGDRVPYNTTLEGMDSGNDGLLPTVWEHVLTNRGGKVDLNKGSFLEDKNGNLLENQVYMFVHRSDNITKRGAEITGGFVNDTETVGTIYGSGE